MHQPQSPAQQIASLGRDDLRILVSGMGVAGATLVRILRQRGFHPVVIERNQPDAGDGYMLGLMPLVLPVLRAAGVEEPYRAASVEVSRYGLRGRHGQLLREYGLDSLVSTFGDYRGISRGALLDVLSAGESPVAFGVSIESIEQGEEDVRVRFTSGDEATFDAVVIAEGMHSTSRDLVLSTGEVSTYDPHWGGWVAWSEPDPNPDLYEEVWGDGFFVGTYPVDDRIGVFVGGDRSDTRVGADAFVERIRGELGHVEPRTDSALRAVADTDDAYYWSLSDVRSDRWAVGRVVLLGDAAAGFLPTAGVGAGMAMESAGQLAVRLAGTSRSEIPRALAAFERTQRPRVESAQSNSRMLARLMFRQNRAFAIFRDGLARCLTLNMALGPIRRLLETAPPVA